VRLEWGLVDVILADLRSMDVARALPHVAHTMQLTWEHSDRRTLRIRDYQAVGGVAGALRRTAEEVYQALDEEDQGVARTVLMRLVRVAPAGGTTRRSVPRHELTGLAPRAGAVLDHLIQHRLVTASEGAVTLSHET